MQSARSRSRHVGAAALLALALTAGAPVPVGLPATGASAAVPISEGSGQADWSWPLTRFRLERAFEAPAHRYGAGHRGIDIRGATRAAVRAPAAGTVAFSGPVAGRSIVTIDHGGGLVTTLEPVESDMPVGTAIAQGEEIASLSVGGHTSPGALHFGVRLHGEYINPMLLLDGVPRAVLLPCC